MKIPHEKFCILPWISLETSPIGSIRPCCLADDEITDDAGQKFDLKTADLDQVRHSGNMKKLRQQFLAGEQPQTCRKCWVEERSGRTSKRMHTLDRLKHIIPDWHWTNDPKPLMFLDLKLGNICNLKCRICGSWSSSQFATEDINDLAPGEKKSSYSYRMLKAGAWPRESEKFWSEIDRCLPDIRYIEFTGGEPFLIDQHFDMLEHLVNKGQADQVEIHYNTNGTVMPSRGPELWKHFKTVEIALSIDDLGQRFEYQRSNANWDEVQNNLDTFVSLKSQMSNIRLQCCTTVNVFNIYYLAEVSAWLEHKPFDFVYWNILQDPWYFSIATLPQRAKQAAADHLDQNTKQSRWRDEFVRIIDLMNKGATSDGFMTRMKIRDLDRKRQQDMAQVMPEWAELLAYQYGTP
jgi:organic radical activating enzyme